MESQAPLSRMRRAAGVLRAPRALLAGRPSVSSRWPRSRWCSRVPRPRLLSSPIPRRLRHRSLRTPRRVPRLRRPRSAPRCSPSLRHPANHRPPFRLSRRRRRRPIPRRARPPVPDRALESGPRRPRARRRAERRRRHERNAAAARRRAAATRRKAAAAKEAAAATVGLVRAPRIAPPEHEIGGRQPLGDPPRRRGSPPGARAGERLAALRGDAEDEGPVAMRGVVRRLVVVLAVVGSSGGVAGELGGRRKPSPSPVIRRAVTTPATGGTRAARSFLDWNVDSCPFHERHRLRRWPLHHRGTRGTHVQGRLAEGRASRRTSGSASTGRRLNSSRSLRTDQRTTTDGSTGRSD